MKISEHDMLLTLATMALKMDDLTRHDIVEAFRALGHGSVIDEAWITPSSRNATAVLGWEGSDGYVTLTCVCGAATELTSVFTDHPVECSSCHLVWKPLRSVVCEPVSAPNDFTGHDVVEALQAHGYGGVVAEARDTKKNERRLKSTLHPRVTRVTATTSENVDSWRKCQLSFKVPQDAAVVGHKLDASEGASILSGSVLESVRPVLRANQDYMIRVANGRFPQHVSLTLILEKP